MHENDYTFVTLDNSEEAPLLGEAVMLDDVQADGTDFITLSDDTVMMSDTDMMDDAFSIDVDGSDISFMV